jgi:hypothetical protein
VDTVESTSIGPGLVAFLIVVALIIATGLLWYSMVRHLRKVPPTFDASPDDQADASLPPSESATNEADDDEPPATAG